MNTATIICSILLFAAFSIAADVAGSGCSVTATIAIRPSASWTDGGNTNQIYDVTVTNNGICPVDNVGLQFGLPSGAIISDQWNMMADDLYYMLDNFGNTIQVGGMFNAAGIVVSTPIGTPASGPVTSNVYGSACPRSCMSSASSSESSSAATESSSSSATTESSSAPSSGTCSATAVIAKDTSTASWTDDQGRTVAVYRLTITNNGECPINNYVLSFGYGTASVVSMWNLQSALGGYQVTGFGDSLPAGASFSGAGLILAGAPDTVSADVYGSACVPCSA